MVTVAEKAPAPTAAVARLTEPPGPTRVSITVEACTLLMLGQAVPSTFTVLPAVTVGGDTLRRAGTSGPTGAVAVVTSTALLQSEQPTRRPVSVMKLHPRTDNTYVVPRSRFPT